MTHVRAGSMFAQLLYLRAHGFAAGTFPRLKALSSITLDQIYHALQGRLLFTELSEIQMGEAVNDIYVGTAHAGPMLTRLLKSESGSRPLVLTTPDRIDTLATAVAAHSSGVAPLAGAAHARCTCARCRSCTPALRRLQLLHMHSLYMRAHANDVTISTCPLHCHRVAQGKAGFKCNARLTFATMLRHIHCILESLAECACRHSDCRP